MEHEQEMAFQSKFPSGSKWGPKEVDTVRFALEPIEQDFATFECDVTFSGANLRILARLADIFAIPVESLQNDDVTAPFKVYRAFYERLAEVLRPEALPDTSLTPLTRSEIRYNTSSPFTAEEQPKTSTAVPSDFGSPESSPAAGASKRKIRNKSTTTSPSRKLGPAMSTSQERVTTASGLEYMADESLPALPEGEHRVSLEKPFRTSHGSSSQFHPAGDDDRTSSKSEEEPSPSSSQTSSSYTESSPRLPSKIVPDSNADVPEDEVVAMFFQFFDVICAEHEMTDGISFIPHYGRDLVISIDGKLVHTRPDLRLSVILSGESVRIPILDYEVRAFSQLCFTIITIAGQTIVRKAKFCAESQRNAWQVLVSEGKTSQ